MESVQKEKDRPMEKGTKQQQKSRRRGEGGKEE